MNQFFKQKKSFTLIELLIVIGILAILTAAVVIVLNPTELLKQGRDSTRMTDLASLSKTIQLLLTQNPSLSLGTASTVYISLPDTSATCANLSLPTLPIGYTYHCVPTASSTLLNSSGWLPIDFTSSIQSLPRLPIDPTNTSSTGLYYTYIANPTTQTYEILASSESKKYITVARQDGGFDPERIEKGSDRFLWQSIYGLVGYWAFNEGSGTQVLDLSGNNNMGTLINGPTWQTASNCKMETCLSFDGSNDYVNLGLWVSAISLKALRGDWSYGVWIKTSTTNGYIVNCTDTGDYVTLSVSAGKAKFLIKDYSPAPEKIASAVSTTSINDNQWHYVTGVWSGDNIYIYVDGVREGSDSGLNGFGNLLMSSWSGSWIVGAQWDSCCSTSPPGNRISMQFIGFISDVRIYNRALPAAEVLAIYNSTR